MTFTPDHTRLSRRAALWGLAIATPTAAYARAGPEKVVTLLGDSITAGYGLAAGDALPAQLEAALRRLGERVILRAAGVSGDTTADGLARIDFSVQPDTDLCLIELGANDLLQGVDPKRTQANLFAIVRRLKARRIRVLIAGLRAPPSVGAGYARDFDAVFPAVARAERTALYPDLLAGVAFDPRLNQKDAIHPNPAGVKIIAGRLAPAVAKALSASR